MMILIRHVCYFCHFLSFLSLYFASFSPPSNQQVRVAARTLTGFPPLITANFLLKSTTKPEVQPPVLKPQVSSVVHGNFNPIFLLFLINIKSTLSALSVLQVCAVLMLSCHVKAVWTRQSENGFCAVNEAGSICDNGELKAPSEH